MNLRVYNTLTKQKEAFVPLEEGKVKMYVCGVTPYNHPHIGNARPFVTWDVIRRYLEQQGWEVMHVQNFTDVDDKIIRTANEEQVPWHAISERYIASYFEVMDKLNVRRAAIYPKVSTHMQEIIDMVAKLVKDGFAYVVDGDVYYAVEKFADYGKLSGRSLDDMKAGARVEVDERKNHPMDFALWKSAKPGEPSWESPWGAGRPGWHIECSAMSKALLGEQFDIHGGGADLQFPHHENEIAQSEGAMCGGDGCGCDEEYKPNGFVRYWMHNGFIRVDNEKMSKSLGNFFTIRDVLKEYDAEVVRFFILRAQYRSPLNYSNEHLNDARAALTRLYTALKDFTDVQPDVKIDWTTPYAAQFKAAMDDDFNTAVAVSVLFDLASEINKSADVALARELKTLAGVLGLLQRDSNEFLRATVGEGEVVNVAEIEVLIEQRKVAKANKDFAQADAIRAQLLEMGIVIEDKAGGVVDWRKA